jgi:hypothetical protein
MNEKPILFSTPMVKAILEGRKTMTRRVVVLPKSAPKGRIPFFENIPDPSLRGLPNGIHSYWQVTPKYLPGDILWVRETWSDFFKEANGEGEYIYKADKEMVSDTFRWNTSLFMPRKAARLFLEVKSVRVERLRDITEEDAEAEGVRPHVLPTCLEHTHREAFMDLWDSLNAKRVDAEKKPVYSWESNPWVWVIEFERVK